MKRSVVRNIARVGLLLLAFAVPVWAAEQATAPIVITAGKASCPTCLTDTSGVNAIADGDLPSLTSSQWASHVSDETGTGAVCFASSPSLTTPAIAGATLTGTIDATGATMNLPSGAVDAIGEVASGIKKGTANVGKLVTFPNTGSTTTNNCAKWDSDGNLVDSGGACGGTSVAPPMVMEGQFPFPGGDVNTFMSGMGNISSTTGQAQSLAAENMTVGGCSAVWVGNPGTGVVVTLASGTYGASLTDSSISITLTTTNTPVSDADTLAITTNQGWNWKVDQASGTAADGQLRITCKRTA